MANPFATNETAAELWFEQTNYAAVNLGAIAYGIHIIVFFMCIHYLIQERKRSNWKWILFVFVLFGLGTVNISLNMHFNELAWIDDRNYPGGPLAFLLEQQSISINTAGNAESIVISALADALLIYRCYVVYQRWWLIVIPILTWVATVVVSVLSVIQAALPNSSLWNSSTLNFSIPYFSLSMALNILLTILLVSRLLYMRQEMASALGAQYGKTYSTIATMILESALPYGLISLVFIVLYAMKNTAASLFIPLLIQVECISPMLIILRVAQGRAWSNDTISQAKLSRLRFASMNNSGSNPANGTETVGSTTIAFKGRSNTNLRSKEYGTTMVTEVHTESV